LDLSWVDELDDELVRVVVEVARQRGKGQLDEPAMLLTREDEEHLSGSLHLVSL